MNDRRARILELAQRELAAAHHRRRARRAGLAAVSAIAIVASGIVISLSLRTKEPAPTSEAGGSTMAGASPVRPIGPERPIASGPAPAVDPRIEVVTAATPSRGFAEILDDRGLTAALGALPEPTGVAIVGGRARLVHNTAMRDAPPSF